MKRHPDAVFKKKTVNKIHCSRSQNGGAFNDGVRAVGEGGGTARGYVLFTPKVKVRRKLRARLTSRVVILRHVIALPPRKDARKVGSGDESEAADRSDEVYARTALSV